jgi:DNA-binding HxlR family transcriptional regulator
MAKRVFSCGSDPSLSMTEGNWKFLILWHLTHSPLSIRGSSTLGRRHQ